MNETTQIRYIGESVTRLEDQRFLTGTGQFVDDVSLPRMVHMAILRSPQAHGWIKAIDLTAAREMPGVLDAFAAADIEMELPDIPLRLAPFKGFERFLQKSLAVDRCAMSGSQLRLSSQRTVILPKTHWPQSSLILIRCPP